MTRLLPIKSKYLAEILAGRKRVELRARRYEEGVYTLTDFRRSCKVHLTPLTEEPIGVEEIPEELLRAAAVTREEARVFGSKLYLHFLKVVDGF